MATTRSDSPASAWQAARETALLVDLSARGRLRCTGSARAEFLHRITTNDIRTLQHGDAAATLVITSKGRLVERLTALCRPDDVLLLTSAGGREIARDALRKYIVVEDVHIEDDTGRTFLLAMVGPAAKTVLAAAAGCPSDELPLLGAWQQRTVAGVTVTVVAEPGPTLSILGDAGDGDTLRAALADAGRAHGLVSTDGAGYEIARIELGIPALGHELTGDFNPLEARQEDALSFDKGCYIGQEVVARLRTYDKVSRQLVRLTIDGEEPVAAGAVVGSGPSAGLVTSAAPLPGAKRTAALALVSRTDRDAGAVVVHAAGGERAARVAGDPVTARDVRVAAPRGLAPGRKRFGQ